MTERSPTVNFPLPYIVLLVVLAMPFVYAAFFTFPTGDDYARSLLAGHIFDVFGGIKEMFRAWMKWSGRYAHHFLIVFFGDAAATRAGYTIACLANMLLHYVCLFGICKELSGPTARKNIATLAMLLFFALLATHGALDTAWYILTDILALGAATGFTLMYIWSLCIMWNAPAPARKHRVFCMVSCILAAGCYEYSTVMAVIISVTAYLLARVYRHPHLAFFRRMCVVSFVCLILSFFARGNFRRRTKRDVDNAVMMAQLAGAWGEWCRHIAPKILTPLYIAIIAVAAWVTPRGETEPAKKVPAWAIILYCFAAAAGFMASMTVLHAASDVTVGEAPKIPAHLSIFCAMIFGFCVFACRETLYVPALRKIPVVLLFLACLGPLVLSYNMRATLVNEASGALRQYAAERGKRKAFMRSVPGEDIVAAPISILPYPVGSDSVRAARKQWPNKYIAPFNNLSGIRAVGQNAAETFAAHPGFLPAWAGWNTVYVAMSDAKGGWWTGAVSAAYAVNVPGTPNAAYTTDWLFLRVTPELLAVSPTLRVAVISEGSVAALVEERFFKKTEDGTIRKPAALNLKRTEREYALADAAFRLPDEAGRSDVALAFPVNASGIAAKSVYISLDGVTYAHAYRTK